MQTNTAIPSITDESFATAVAPGTGLVAVEFGAEWCGPCHMLAPVLDAVARDYAPSLRVVQMDTDANPATMVRFGVRGLPTVLLFRDGVPVDRIVGAVPAATLRGRIDKAIAG